MLENRGLSDWNGINSEIENEEAASSSFDHSDQTVGSAESNRIDDAKAPKEGSETSSDSSLGAVAPDNPASEPVAGWLNSIPTMSLGEAASVMRNDLSSGSKGWGALRSPILDVITGKTCFSLGTTLVSGMVANCRIDPLQTVGSVEDVYWKAVGDDLSKWKEAALGIYEKAVEFPSKVIDQTKSKFTKLANDFKGMDFVLSAFGADMGFPIYTVGKGWLKASPTVDFSTTLSGCNLRFNIRDETKPKQDNTEKLGINQLSGTISINASMLRYFGMSFNSDDSLSALFGYTVALPLYNPSISADTAARGISDYGTAVGKELGKINHHFVERINRILYDR